MKKMFCYYSRLCSQDYKSLGKLIYFNLDEQNAVSKAALDSSVESIDTEIKNHKRLDWSEVEKDARNNLNLILNSKRAEFKQLIANIDSQITAIGDDPVKQNQKKKLENQKNILQGAKQELERMIEPIITKLKGDFDVAQKERAENAKKWSETIKSQLQEAARGVVNKKENEIGANLLKDVSTEFTGVWCKNENGEIVNDKWNAQEAKNAYITYLETIYVFQGPDKAQKQANKMIEEAKKTNNYVSYATIENVDSSVQIANAEGLNITKDNPRWTGFSWACVNSAREFFNDNQEGYDRYIKYIGSQGNKLCEKLNNLDDDQKDSAALAFIRTILSPENWSAQYFPDALKNRNEDVKEYKTQAIHNIVNLLPDTSNRDRLQNILVGAVAGVNDTKQVDNILKDLLGFMGILNIKDPEQWKRINIGQIDSNAMTTIEGYDDPQSNKKALQEQVDQFGQTASSYINGLMARVLRDPSLKDKKVNDQDFPGAYREYLQKWLKNDGIRADLSEMRLQYVIDRGKLKATHELTALDKSFHQKIASYIQKNLPTPDQFLAQVQPPAKTEQKAADQPQATNDHKKPSNAQNSKSKQAKAAPKKSGKRIKTASVVGNGIERKPRSSSVDANPSSNKLQASRENAEKVPQEASKILQNHFDELYMGVKNIQAEVNAAIRRSGNDRGYFKDAEFTFRNKKYKIGNENKVESI